MGKTKGAKRGPKRGPKGRWARAIDAAVGAAAAVATGAAHSYTGAKTKNRTMQVVKQSSYTTKSRAGKYNKVVSKEMKKESSNDARYQRASDATTRAVATVGRQSVQIVGIMGQVTGLIDQFAQQSATATGKWFMNTFSSVTELHNQGNSCCKVWIYDLICKQDSADSPVVAWDTGLSTDQGAAATAYLYPFATPTLSKAFNQTWKVIKCTKLFLEAGQSHVHSFMHAVNKTMTQDRYEDVNVYVAGVTTVQMIVTLGSLDNDSSTKSQVSYGGTAVNVYVKSKSSFQTVANNALKSVSSIALPTAFTVGESVMLEDTDVAAVFTSA